MQEPAYIPLKGDRGVLLAAIIVFFGFDLTGATARMQVRTDPDVGGTALLSLTMAGSPTAQGLRIVYAGTATVAAHIAADRIERADLPQEFAGLADTDNLTLTLLGIRVLAANMAFATAPAAEKGDDEELAYDILLTPSGGDEDKYARGPFIVRGTVTQ